MKTKTIISITILISFTISISCKKLNLEHEEARNIEIKDIDFSKLNNGEYNGYYAGGMYGCRENECKVTVDISKVTDIELIKSKEDRPIEFFNELYIRVIEKQSLKVDVISGATLTSKAHLKAIENALVKAEQDSLMIK